MAEAKGKLKTCDRCSEWIFLKAIDDGVTDGGYTRWNRFEDAPEGWDYDEAVEYLKFVMGEDD